VLALGAAAVALAAAAVLLLLAVDVRRYERAVADDDAAFTVDPAREDLWRPPQLVPGGAARRLLGLDDELAYRRAVRLFALGRPRVNALLASPPMQAYRSEAAIALWRLAQRDHDLARRSHELNLVGVLDFVSAGPNDPVKWVASLVRASASFRRSITADDTGAADAKFNLEVALRLAATIRANTTTLKGLGGSATESTEFGSGY
jgi:hypothetical protein